MVVKDKVVSWFFLHYIMPRSQIIDKPGFVVFKVSHKTDIYSRQVVMPESLFVEIEKHISKKFGEKGCQALYSTGKKFGYRFAQVSNVIDIKGSDPKSFLSYVNMLSKFVEGTYASNIRNEVDLDKREIKFFLKNFVICRKSGIGFLVSVGGIGGIWARMMADPAIEAFQKTCQGKGDKECLVIASPKENLKSYGAKVFTETGLDDLAVDRKYRKINEITPVRFADKSLKDFIDARIFSFKNGILTYRDHRYFIVEASFSYLIENELRKLKGADADLFKLSFDYGKSLSKNKLGFEPCKYIGEFMSCLGWGDVRAEKKPKGYELRIAHFPWTKFADKSNLTIFRGIASGIISGMTSKKVTFQKVQKRMLQGHYFVTIKE